VDVEDYSREREACLAAVREAGALAQRSFGGTLQVEDKPDNQGPVSDADRACDALLRERLGAAFPDDALLTEESKDDGAWHTARRVWMIDPIDGTQEYVEGIPQYAVMVGLCVDGVPKLGAVFAPAQDLLVFGVVGAGASVSQAGEERPLSVRSSPLGAGYTAVVSRSHRSARDERLCAALGEVALKPLGSVGLKLAAVSQGEADLYLASTHRIKLWDTCGPQAVLEAAGGRLVDLFGEPLDYREQINHPHGLLACPAPLLDALLAQTRPIAAEYYGGAA